ncbi:septal ring lytic transglycosylase RlpA family protein [Altererythrobacter sp. Root672]|uniref:septal ring lytic transglycosylase RlpA family protein n=1 Tax=Altererythrobacter sp. Root672 TaxID=1736584 RepID=UPI001F48E346|nr:septal ring lytic transglycosylase RlpA family protein [Altererythrobacter sp. Root672]
MDGNTTMKLRMALAGLALAALSGSIAPALAEVTAETATAPATSVAAATTNAELPHFVPSTNSAEASIVTFQEAVVQPLAEEEEAREISGGVASWYGREFEGRRTASGERFDPDEYTAAHRTLPFGSKVRVSRNGHSVVVRINDRGPFHGGRVIDLSQAAAEDLGIRSAGSGRVELAVLGDD